MHVLSRDNYECMLLFKDFPRNFSINKFFNLLIEFDIKTKNNFISFFLSYFYSIFKSSLNLNIFLNNFSLTKLSIYLKYLIDCFDINWQKITIIELKKLSWYLLNFSYNFNLRLLNENFEIEYLALNNSKMKQLLFKNNVILKSILKTSTNLICNTYKKLDHHINFKFYKKLITKKSFSNKNPGEFFNKVYKEYVKTPIKKNVSSIRFKKILFNDIKLKQNKKKHFFQLAKVTNFKFKHFNWINKKRKKMILVRWLLSKNSRANNNVKRSFLNVNNYSIKPKFLNLKRLNKKLTLN